MRHERKVLFFVVGVVVVVVVVFAVAALVVVVSVSIIPIIPFIPAAIANLTYQCINFALILTGSLIFYNDLA